MDSSARTRSKSDVTRRRTSDMPASFVRDIVIEQSKNTVARRSCDRVRSEIARADAIVVPWPCRQIVSSPARSFVQERRRASLRCVPHARRHLARVRACMRACVRARVHFPTFARGERVTLGNARRATTRAETTEETGTTRADRLARDASCRVVTRRDALYRSAATHRDALWCVRPGTADRAAIYTFKRRASGHGARTTYDGTESRSQRTDVQPFW